MSLSSVVLSAQAEVPDADGNGGGVLGLLIALLSFAALLMIFFGLPVWGIVDAIMRSPEDWKAAGQSKSLWIVIQFFVWIIGSAVYVLAVRPHLKRAARIRGGSEHA